MISKILEYTFIVTIIAPVVFIQSISNFINGNYNIAIFQLFIFSILIIFAVGIVEFAKRKLEVVNIQIHHACLIETNIHIISIIVILLLFSLL